MENLKARHAPSRTHPRNSIELDRPQPFYRWRLYLFLVKAFEVIEVSELAWLADAFAADKSLVAIEAKSVVDVVEVAHEEEDCADRCPCSPLARIAMHNNSVFRIRYTE